MWLESRFVEDSGRAIGWRLLTMEMAEVRPTLEQAGAAQRLGARWGQEASDSRETVGKPQIQNAEELEQ